MYNKETSAFGTHFMTIMAALASLVTLLSYLTGNLSDIHYSYDAKLRLAYIIGISILSLCWLYAYYQTKTKLKIKLTIQDSLDLTIEEGNLFNKRGIICIPFNDFFDTDTNNLIDPQSLPGRFINQIWKGDPNELHLAIERSLSEQNIIGEINQVRRRPEAYTTRYKLGTCAKVEQDGIIYVLVAQTKYDQDDRIIIERSEFNDVVGCLLRYLEIIAGTKPVYMPILGSGLTPLKRSPQRILNNIISVIDFEHPIHLVGGLTIVTSSLFNKGIDLNQTESHFMDLE